MSNLKYLITGAAGFVGSNLSENLSKTGHQILAIDNFSPYYSQNFKKIRVEKMLNHKNIKFLNCDLNNYRKLYRNITKFQPDVVIHLAAQPGVRLPYKDNYKYIDSNIHAFDNLINILKEMKLRSFLFASSSSVYGDTIEFPLSEKSKLLSPKSFYGITKLTNELVVRNLSAKLNFPTRGMRFFTAYGPWGRPDMLYFKLIANALNSKKTTIYGDGTTSRDFTYIDDLVKSIVDLSYELCRREPGFTDIVNIGGGSSVTMNTLIDVISNRLNSKLQIEYKKKHEGDVNKTLADTSYLKELIGYQPATDIISGIDRTITWASETNIRMEILKWSNSVN